MSRMAGADVTTRRSRSSAKAGKSFGRVEDGFSRRYRRVQVAAKYWNAARYSSHLSGIKRSGFRHSNLVECGRESVPAFGPPRTRYSRAALALPHAAASATRTSGRVFSGRVTPTNLSQINSA